MVMPPAIRCRCGTLSPAAAPCRKGTRRPRPRSPECMRPNSSFDDLVGAGEDRWRDRQAGLLRCLQVDHQLEFGRLLDRQVSWTFAPQDLVDVSGGAAPQLVKARPVRH